MADENGSQNQTLATGKFINQFYVNQFESGYNVKKRWKKFLVLRRWVKSGRTLIIFYNKRHIGTTIHVNANVTINLNFWSSLNLFFDTKLVSGMT